MRPPRAAAADPSTSAGLVDTSCRGSGRLSPRSPPVGQLPLRGRDAARESASNGGIQRGRVKAAQGDQAPSRSCRSKLGAVLRRHRLEWLEWLGRVVVLGHGWEPVDLRRMDLGPSGGEHTGKAASCRCGSDAGRGRCDSRISDTSTCSCLRHRPPPAGNTGASVTGRQADASVTRMPSDPIGFRRTPCRPRYELVLEPDLTTATFAGTVAASITVTERSTELVCNAIELGFHRPGARPAAAINRVHDDDRRRDGASPRHPRHAARAGSVHVARAVHRPAERKARRVLPLDLRGRRGGRAHRRGHPVRGDARAACVPVLGRARAQAIPALTLVIPNELAAVANSGVAHEEPVASGKRRITYADIDVERTSTRGWSVRSRSPAREGGAHRAAHRSTRTAPGRSLASRSSPARSRSTGSPPTTGSATRATSATSSPCPTSPSGRWRTSAASRSARPSCSSTPTAPRSPSCSAWPT